MLGIVLALRDFIIYSEKLATNIEQLSDKIYITFQEYKCQRVGPISSI